MNYGNKWLSYVNETLVSLNLTAKIKVPARFGSEMDFGDYSNLLIKKDVSVDSVFVEMKSTINNNEVYYNDTKFILMDASHYFGHERLLMNISKDARRKVIVEMLNKTKVWQIKDLYLLLEPNLYGHPSANVFKINHATLFNGYDLLKSYLTDNDANLVYEGTYRYDLITKLNTLIPVYTKPFDLGELNLEKCADSDKNKVFVFRRGLSYGSFEIDQNDLDNDNFVRCTFSGYITTALSNYFNERTSNPTANGPIASILIQSVKACKDCGLMDFSMLTNGTTTNPVSNYGNHDFCKSCADNVVNNGLDLTTYTPNLYSVSGYGSNPNKLNFGKFESEAVPLYMGVELEVDTQYGNGDDFDDEENDDNDQFDMNERNTHSNIALHKIANGTETIFSKTDGSLNNGFEIVSHPLTLATHLKKMQWQKGMDYLTKIGYKSHNTNTCGLHIHINRNFFGATKPNQNLNGAKIAYLMEKNQFDFVKFTRRKGGQLDRWARFGDMSRYISPQVSPRTKSMLLTSFRNQYPHRNKYVALNTIHPNTFEFRIFKGTLNYGTFVATLQLVDNLARLVKDIPNTDDAYTYLDKITFDDIVNYRPYAELTAYWTSRKVAK